MPLELSLMLQEKRMNEIVNECGKFFDRDKPLIPDIDYLPYTKEVLTAALKWKDQQLCDIANMYVADGSPDKLPPIEKGIEAVHGIQTVLLTYTMIDAEDQDRVEYFNENYKTIESIPGSERTEFGKLLHKYISKAWKAMSSTVPD